eukprot:CAMPEP_0117677262 /NCGR_PEP_ID=MMETSP0804-20121206/16651_1 /TAXON_ID=1074897 /ORGANISM="Tetraselmis astigmatica, Strain CCMP880" /LENGTH=94 /DNA_ID=CAMNT_0005486533 /DNA_START=267 /DNA_END=547 /DNA_ORIENTATION=+
MSEIFDQYELDYGELRSELSVKVAAIASLSGELRAGKVSEVEHDVAEGEALLRRMELEARTLGAAQKTQLMSKVKAYRVELVNLKSEARSAASG